MASTDSLFSASSHSDDHRKEKSPNALRTISEASDILDVPQHVLRFWETKFSQIRPLKRNGGRRFYRPQDLEILQQIKHLLYSQGYTIKGAKKAVEDFARHAEHSAGTPWQAPPANVNDNAAAARAQQDPSEDIIAELAEALNDDADAKPRVKSDKEALKAIRADLARVRDILRARLNVAA